MEAVIRSVKRACYAGLDSVTLRREVAARAAPVLAFNAHAFGTTDPDTGLLTHVLAEGVPDSMVNQYVELLYPHECARIAIDMPRKGSPVFSMPQQSREACAMLHAHGLRYEVYASLAAAGRLWGSWCLMRMDGSPSMESRARAFLHRLAPHVARGLQSAALIGWGLAPADELTRESAPGVLVLDARNRPVLRTAIATAWLEDLADVGLHVPDGIPLSVLGLAAQLRLARVDVPQEMRVRARGRSGRWYTIRASLAEPDASGECTAVVVVRPVVPREMATILTRLYGLSAREREIIAAIARGNSTKRIAALLGVSPHTVTEHIERACQKIGVRGRKALIAKLFFDGYAPMLRSGFARSATAAVAPRRVETPGSKNASS